MEILAAKSSMLGGSRRQKESESGGFWRVRYREFLAAVYNQFALSGASTPVRNTARQPERLFETMLSLAGCLTTFSSKVHPRDLPLYEHDNLSKCFTSLDETVRMLLETVVPTNCISLPLKLVQPSIYATALADDKYLVGTRMYLAISAEMNEAELISKNPIPGEGLFRQSYRTSGAPGATRSGLDSRPQASRARFR